MRGWHRKDQRRGRRIDIGEESEALSSCTCDDSTYKVYDPAGSVLVGPARSSYICWPSRYDLRPGVTSPYFIVDDYNGNYSIQGSGEATCVKRCCFNSNGGSQDQRLLSDNFEASTYAVSGHTGTAKVDMWQSDAMPLLTGLSHAFNPAAWSIPTGFDDGRVSSNSNPAKVATLTSEAYGESGNEFTAAYGYSFFVGIPGGTHVVREFDYGPYYPGALASLISSSAGICTISELDGSGGPSYAARLTRPGGTWVLSMGTLTGNTAARAYVRCYLFDQSQ